MSAPDPEAARLRRNKLLSRLLILALGLLAAAQVIVFFGHAA